MNRIYICVVCMLACVLCSCGNEKKPALKENERQEALVVTEQDMQPVQSVPVKRNDRVKLDGTEYVSEILQNPDESLPLVKCDDGTEYVDNRVSLKLYSASGRKVVDRSFTKTDFAPALNANFKAKGALEGFIFEKAENGKFHYTASICYPQSDMCIYIRVSFDKNGQFLLSQADDLSTTFAEE